MSFEDNAKKVLAFLPTLEQIATVAATLAKVVPGVGNVVSAIELGVKIANGIANEVPQAVKVWNDVQAAAAGGQAISDAEWAQWQKDINEAHIAFVSAAAKVINKP